MPNSTQRPTIIFTKLTFRDNFNICAFYYIVNQFLPCFPLFSMCFFVFPCFSFFKDFSCVFLLSRAMTIKLVPHPK